MFLEFIAATSHFAVRSPYLTLSDRIEKFIQRHIRPTKVPAAQFRKTY